MGSKNKLRKTLSSTSKKNNYLKLSVFLKFTDWYLSILIGINFCMDFLSLFQEKQDNFTGIMLVGKSM